MQTILSKRNLGLHETILHAAHRFPDPKGVELVADVGRVIFLRLTAELRFTRLKLRIL